MVGRTEQAEARDQMKKDNQGASQRIRQWARVGVLAVGLGLVLLAAALNVHSQSAPALKITLSTNSQVQLVITNGYSTNVYEIYRRLELLPTCPWVLHLTGTNGQTNFMANMGIAVQGFFAASTGTNWDGDVAPNWADANPTNSAVTWLTVTIVSPANGANLY